MIRILQGDCIDILKTLEPDSIDACMTDPPYGLEFMGVAWDTFADPKGGPRTPNTWGDHGSKEHARTAKDAARVARNKNRDFEEFGYAWACEAYRVLKPGAHLLAFGGTRTYHRLACAIEDAGFEIRDQFAWMYGSGFPKSRDASKAIDQELGAKRDGGVQYIALDGRPRGLDLGVQGGKFGAHQSDYVAEKLVTAPATPEANQRAGWGTAVKPAWEPLVLARKPMVGNLAQNLLKHGTGAINIDATRIPSGPDHAAKCASVVGLDSNRNGDCYGEWTGKRTDSYNALGRWPANVAHDGSDEVEAAFAAFGESTSSGGSGSASQRSALGGHVYGEYSHTKLGQNAGGLGDRGTASRFFYTAKADKDDRAGSKHPTVKPVDLIRYYIRLITPPAGTVLDCFAGSGTTGEAAMLEGFDAILIERDEQSVADIRHRIKRWSGLDMPLFAD